MAVEVTTIQSAVEKINTNYFLPIMQRPFVWEGDQIIGLFDSIMRNYPFGTILLWKIPTEILSNIDAYKISNDIKIGTPSVPTPNFIQNEHSRLILDGQQRLTSLYIGLYGCIRERSTRWNATSLYIDLLKNSETENLNEEKGYSFSFRPTNNQLRYSDGKFWFPVRNILNIRDEATLNERILHYKDLCSGYTVSTHKLETLELNLKRLYEAIKVEKSLIFSTYTSSNSEEVLDIFVRLNSGGKQLKRSDLLISTLSVYWPSDEKFRRVLDDLKRDLKNIIDSSRLDDDFIMKSVLFFLAKRVEYDIKTFNQDFAIEVHNNWEQIRTCLIAAVRCAQRNGIDERTLSSANALLPIALFCKLTSFNPNAQTLPNQTTLKTIGKWLTASLLAGVYSGTSDSMLTKHREVIHAAFNRNSPNNFPDINLNQAVAMQNRVAPYSEDAINKLLSLNYDKSANKPSIQLILRLLQQKYAPIPQDLQPGELHLDHLVPKSLFPTDMHTQNRHDIANLALMYGTDNMAFGDIPLPEKFDRIANNRFRSGLLLDNIPRELWSVENFNEFLNQRRANLFSEFIDLFRN
jgi:hypothetical protein